MPAITHALPRRFFHSRTIGKEALARAPRGFRDALARALLTVFLMSFAKTISLVAAGMFLAFAGSAMATVLL